MPPVEYGSDPVRYRTGFGGGLFEFVVGVLWIMAMRWSLGLSNGRGEGVGPGGGGVGRAKIDGAGVGVFAPTGTAAGMRAATSNNHKVRDFMKGSFPG